MRFCKGTPLRGGGTRKSNKSEDFRVEQVRPRTLRRAPVIKMRFPLHSLPPLPTPFPRFLLCASRRVAQFLPVTLEGYTAAHTPIFSRFVQCRIVPQSFVYIYRQILRNITALYRVIPKSYPAPLENRRVKRTKTAQSHWLALTEKSAEG